MLLIASLSCLKCEISGAKNCSDCEIVIVIGCKSDGCATMSNTRIFAGHFKFGEFRAILRGVVVKKIHNLLAQKTNTTASEKIFLTKNFVEKKIFQKYCF
jgi:hypothetical protein